MRKWCCFLAVLWIASAVQAQETEVIYLSGTDKDHTVAWNFFCTKGRNSGKWSTIPVPSNWELQGFGTYNYGQNKTLADEQGLYKREFNVPSTWKGKTVFIAFEGSMTDTEVKINGRSAGPVHQGAFYRFRYDITPLLKFGGRNLLEATVSKMSSNSSVNEAERTADYWVFGGIFRPVVLEAYPPESIDRVAIDARSDGSFSMDVFLRGISKALIVEARIQAPNGKPFGKPMVAAVRPAQERVVVSGRHPDPDLWSPEFPNLYDVVVSLKDASAIVHQTAQRFGFRTVDVKAHDGIFVNGQKIMFRGVCRHSFWPTSGRCLSKELSVLDVNLMKDMNMNAVRMSHYPPDRHFLDACDSLGLFVIDELAGWQYPPYDTVVGKKLVREMVIRDVNHPSILLWANGNEGGHNFDLLNDYALVDPQKRRVIQPWDNLNNLDTQHYINFNYGVGASFQGRDIFFPTELLHGLYDGGLGAGLEDYWNLMLANPLSAGGFLWVFSDEGVVRKDKKDSIDTNGNNAPDGILGPYREKEGSYFTIKDIWSPVQFEKKIVTREFDGNLRVTNRFSWTRFGQCTFSGELVQWPGKFPAVETLRKRITVESPDIPPGDSGALHVDLPADWKSFDMLCITAVDPRGRNINTWSWNLTSPEAMASRTVTVGGEPVTAREDADAVIVSSGNTEIRLSKTSGLLIEARKGDRRIPLGDGPILAGADIKFRGLRHYASGNNWVVELTYESRPEFRVKWTMMPGGWVQLDYDYRQPGSYDFMGITFKVPENLVTGVRLMANGPYRVWKNRMKGPRFGIYDKAYNNTVTGESWEYPEFKGYYSNFYAVEIQTRELPFTLLSATEDLFLHLFTPSPPKGAYNNNTAPPFPTGNLSFLHGIPPIGTKFSKPEAMGPQSGKNEYNPNRNTENLGGRLYFRFGE